MKKLLIVVSLLLVPAMAAGQELAGKTYWCSKKASPSRIHTLFNCGYGLRRIVDYIPDLYGSPHYHVQDEKGNVELYLAELVETAIAQKVLLPYDPEPIELKEQVAQDLEQKQLQAARELKEKQRQAAQKQLAEKQAADRIAARTAKIKAKG